MFGYETIDLKTDKGKSFYYQKRKIEGLLEEVNRIIEEHNYLSNIHITIDMLLSFEIKANNAIEGIKDDFDSIIRAIIEKKAYTEEEKSRILNLYFGYKYILKNKTINEKSLNELYKILSKDLLDDFSKENMGVLYRKKEVYILNSTEKIIPEYDTGIHWENINKYMDDLFDYLNAPVKNEKEAFLKSQIIHFYFVYVHPYFDINGRTARTFSLWYLLRKKAYPYTIFNRGISITKNQYKKAIQKSRKGNLTYFLVYMLNVVKEELEKEIIIWNIKENCGENLTLNDLETLEYILTSKQGKLSEIRDLFFQNDGYNQANNMLVERIYPLIEKGILTINEKEQRVVINRKYLNGNKTKLKK